MSKPNEEKSCENCALGDTECAYFRECHPGQHIRWRPESPAPAPEPRTLASLGIKPGTRLSFNGKVETLVALLCIEHGFSYTNTFFDEAIILPDEH